MFCIAAQGAYAAGNIWSIASQVCEKAAVVAPKPKPYERNPDQFAYRFLSKPPDLPDLPPWPDSFKPIESIISPHAKGGPVYQVQFSCLDKPDRVTQFYMDRLADYHWEILKHTGSMIFAQRNYDIVSLQTQPSTTANGKCNLLVIYAYNNKVGNNQ